MNPRLIKITAEIERIRNKIVDFQSRLKDLERHKTEVENADIVAMVRGIDIPPAEFEAFVLAFQNKQNCSITDVSKNTMSNDEEDSSIEK